MNPTALQLKACELLKHHVINVTSDYTEVKSFVDRLHLGEDAVFVVELEGSKGLAAKTDTIYRGHAEDFLGKREWITADAFLELLLGEKGWRPCFGKPIDLHADTEVYATTLEGTKAAPRPARDWGWSQHLNVATIIAYKIVDDEACEIAVEPTPPSCKDLGIIPFEDPEWELYNGVRFDIVQEDWEGCASICLNGAAVYLGVNANKSYLSDFAKRGYKRIRLRRKKPQQAEESIVGVAFMAYIAGEQQHVTLDLEALGHLRDAIIAITPQLAPKDS